MSPHSLIGKTAPSFTLPATSGEDVTITPGQSGKPLVVFFYPKANTAVCTKEACAFRDALKVNDLYKNSDVQVVGISADPVATNKAWAEQHELNYTILSDTDRKVRKEYDVSGGLLGLVDGRYTFVIDSKGIVRDVETSTLNAAAHIKFVDKAIASL